MACRLSKSRRAAAAAAARKIGSEPNIREYSALSRIIGTE
jgi:hypothetical protein